MPISSPKGKEFTKGRLPGDKSAKKSFVSKEDLFKYSAIRINGFKQIFNFLPFRLKMCT